MTKYYVKIIQFSEFWCIDPQFDISHRVFGPASKLWKGALYWYQNDELHRENGPAVIYPDGNAHYWLRGVLYKKDQYDEILRGD